MVIQYQITTDIQLVIISFLLMPASLQCFRLHILNSQCSAIYMLRRMTVRA